MCLLIMVLILLVFLMLHIVSFKFKNFNYYPKGKKTQENFKSNHQLFQTFSLDLTNSYLSCVLKPKNPMKNLV